MIDHHVDRPQVEVQQCMQPSGPNRPIDLHHTTTKQPIPSTRISTARSTKPRTPHTPTPQHQPSHHPIQDPVRWPGGHRGDDTPDPIPNSAVKHPSAHGTAAQAAGESVAAGPPGRILHNTHQSRRPEQGRRLSAFRCPSAQITGTALRNGAGTRRGTAPLYFKV